MTKIGIIGGTGPEGLGLAMRFAKAGDQLFIGSRAKERAEEAARKVKEALPEAKAQGLVNAEAVEEAAVVFLTLRLLRNLGFFDIGEPAGGGADRTVNVPDVALGACTLKKTPPCRSTLRAAA